MNENKLKSESNESIILQALFKNSELRFKDLQEKTGLSPPTLTKRLKNMEKHGIVIRKIRIGERWPYYTIYSPQLIKEFIFPVAVWNDLIIQHPDGTTFDNVLQMVGGILIFLIIKEKTKNRNHDTAIESLIRQMKHHVDVWIEDGILEKYDWEFEKQYKKYIESEASPEVLNQIGRELVEKAKDIEKMKQYKKWK